MKEYSIYEKEMCGDGIFVEVITANTKEEALQLFFQKSNILDNEDMQWLYFAVDKAKDDEETEFLRKSGFATGDDYYREMYPSRPIEL